MSAAAAPTINGRKIDALYALREQRLALERQVDQLREKEHALEEELIELCGKARLNGAKGKLASITVMSKLVASVKEWDLLYAYIKRNNAFELLQRRVSDAAVNERWAAKQQVPGVEPFQVTKLSVRKL